MRRDHSQLMNEKIADKVKNNMLPKELNDVKLDMFR